jgi:hypothetical protein
MNIIELAKQAGFQDADWNYTKGLEAFAELVRADEREECAKIADEWDKVNKLSNYGAFIALQIRARGTT